MDEFELIRRYFAELTPPRADVALGIGDDAALLTPPRGHEVVVTTDTLIAGRHFPEDTDPQAVGWKALAVNLSDLAAMGAEPRWFTLALTLRMVDPEWLAGFAAGLGAMAREVGVALGGGRGEARSADLEHLRARLHRPVPRVAAGAALRDLAHAAIDLSDGLAGDLSHILDASGVGAELRTNKLPMSPAFKNLSEPEERLELQMSGGDDYELCVCLPAADVAKLRKRLDEIGRAHV